MCYSFNMPPTSCNHHLVMCTRHKNAPAQHHRINPMCARDSVTRHILPQSAAIHDVQELPTTTDSCHRDGIVTGQFIHHCLVSVPIYVEMGGMMRLLPVNCRIDIFTTSELDEVSIGPTVHNVPTEVVEHGSVGSASSYNVHARHGVPPVP